MWPLGCARGNAEAPPAPEVASTHPEVTPPPPVDGPAKPPLPWWRAMIERCRERDSEKASQMPHVKFMDIGDNG